jgi:hypothetical protein
MALTAKQEAFAQCVANGMTQSAAYRSAYDVSPETKPEGIHVDASQLAAEPKVALRIKELRDLLVMADLWSREQSVNALKGIVVGNESKAGEITAAIKELNSMYGFNAAQKHQHSGEDGGPIQHTVEVVFGRSKDEG